MAQNRMYLVNRKTKTVVYLSKFYHGIGWNNISVCSLQRKEDEKIGKRINDGFEISEHGKILSDKERDDFSLGRLKLHARISSVDGDDWRIVYDSDEKDDEMLEIFKQYYNDKEKYNSRFEEHFI